MTLAIYVNMDWFCCTRIQQRWGRAAMDISAPMTTLALLPDKVWIRNTASIPSGFWCFLRYLPVYFRSPAMISLAVPGIQEISARSSALIIILGTNSHRIHDGPDEMWTRSLTWKGMLGFHFSSTAILIHSSTLLFLPVHILWTLLSNTPGSPWRVKILLIKNTKLARCMLAHCLVLCLDALLCLTFLTIVSLSSFCLLFVSAPTLFPQKRQNATKFRNSLSEGMSLMSWSLPLLTIRLASLGW